MSIDYLLLEDGSALLLESGDNLLLESSGQPTTARPRYQRGTVVLFGIVPGMTDRNPVATIVGPGPATLGAYPMPLLANVSVPTYRLRLRLPGGIALGTYQVTYSYSVAGVQGLSSESFDVIPGGDSGGEVISLYSYDRPEGRYILAQVGSGKLVQGRNPHL